MRTMPACVMSSVQRIFPIPGVLVPLLLVPGTSLLGQGMMIGSQVKCPTCRIAVGRILTVGSPDDHPTGPYDMARDGRGRWFVAYEDGSPVRVFDSNGRFRNQIGREGEGPGEYRSPRIVRVTNGDSIQIYDSGLGRLSILSATMQFVRSVTIPRHMDDALQLPRGDIIVNARVFDTERVGLPLHQLTAAGGWIRSYGGDRAVLMPGDVVSGVRFLSSAGANTFWTVRMTGLYELDRWDTDGNRRDRIQRQAEFFEPYEQFWFASPTRKPPSRTVGLWANGDTVWVVLQVADKNWARGLGAARRGEGGQTIYPDQVADHVFDTVIEALDTRRGHVIARTQIDRSADLVVAPGMIAAHTESTTGMGIEVITVTLVQ